MSRVGDKKLTARQNKGVETLVTAIFLRCEGLAETVWMQRRSHEASYDYERASTMTFNRGDVAYAVTIEARREDRS